MLIEENKLYTEKDVRSLLQCSTNTARNVMKKARVFKESNEFLILGKNLIEYIDQMSTDKPK